jgi:hypothetical protein
MIALLFNLLAPQVPSFLLRLAQLALHPIVDRARGWLRRDDFDAKHRYSLA